MGTSAPHPDEGCGALHVGTQSVSRTECLTVVP